MIFFRELFIGIGWWQLQVLISIGRFVESEIVVLTFLLAFILLIITLLNRFLVIIRTIVTDFDNLVEQSGLLVRILSTMIVVVTFLRRVSIAVLISLKIAIAVIVAVILRFIFVLVFLRHLCIIILLFPEGEFMLEVKVVEEGLLVNKQTRRADAFVARIIVIVIFPVNATIFAH